MYASFLALHQCSVGERRLPSSREIIGNAYSTLLYLLVRELRPQSTMHKLLCRPDLSKTMQREQYGAYAYVDLGGTSASPSHIYCFQQFKNLDTSIYGLFAESPPTIPMSGLCLCVLVAYRDMSRL